MGVDSAEPESRVPVGEHNPYAPPRAEPPPLAAPSEDVPSEQEGFMLVSTGRIVVMTILTCGLYDAYWMYRQWQAIRASTRRPISPLGRAVFGILWCNSLFHSIRRATMAPDAVRARPTGGLAALYILPHVATFAIRGGNPLIPISIGFLSLGSIAIMQREINAAAVRTSNAPVSFEPVTPTQIVLIVVGMVLLLAIAVAPTA